MSDIHHHPSWPVYKKLRSTIARFLERLGLPADNAAVDRQLEQHLDTYTYDLVILFHRDQHERNTRELLNSTRMGNLNAH